MQAVRWIKNREGKALDGKVGCACLVGAELCCQGLGARAGFSLGN